MKKLCIFLILILYGCDFDKYLGYDNKAQELLNTAAVSGSITNFYTDDPVSNALVKVGQQETLTNSNGLYSLNYVLTDDEERNKPVHIHISAHNYYPDSITTLIEPLDNMYNFQLRYAAPMIKDIVRQQYRFFDICQAIVSDYQGWQDIDSVYALFYPLSGEQPVKVPLALVYNDGQNTGYYQVTYEKETTMDLPYSVIAVDFDKYTDRLDKANNPFNPVEDLIF